MVIVAIPTPSGKIKEEFVWITDFTNYMFVLLLLFF